MVNPPTIMQGCQLFFTVLLTAASLTNSATASSEVTFGISKAISLPYAQITQKESGYDAESGILVEIAHFLSQHINRTVNIKVIERYNIASALMNGSVDIHCYLTPGWLPNIGNSVNWSKTIFPNKDILISRKQLKPILTMRDLEGKSIGIVQNYKYPLIEELISQGKINTLAVRNEQTNFMQLFRSSDVDAIIFNEITYDYLYKKYSNKNKFPVLKHPLIIEFIEPKCAISKHSDLSLPEVNQAIDKMQSNKIISSYLNKIAM